MPMFVITSSLYDRDIAESYQLGASAVLCKPLSRAKLRDELVRVGALPPRSGRRTRLIGTSHAESHNLRGL